jgi:putative nucleotidyltransferase with HDIG domain
MRLFKKTSPRRNQVRKNIATEHFLQISQLANAHNLVSGLLLLLFIAMCTSILSFEQIQEHNYRDLTPMIVIVALISVASTLYIYHYQKRIIQNHVRAMVLAGMFCLLLITTKLGIVLTKQSSWATGTAVTAAIILAIAYDQRFAIGMSIFYASLACFVAPPVDISLFLIMSAGIFSCCFSLTEIRTRMKLLEVSTLATVIVFIMSISLDFMAKKTTSDIFVNGGWHAMATFMVGLFIQSLLPVIEKTFRIATSMTLLDYSDANQPLLKRLAMEAPGTFSHSLLVGSIAEAAAESIGCNGLLCRVGAYYHDIGKINKPGYFVENEIGSVSRHGELSPAMSQLIIVGHVKDGIEMAKEYGLPAVLRQFIETHHGTTLVEYFFSEAKKKKDGKQPTPSESEFRYVGPKPRTKEAAIVMLADTAEGTVRSMPGDLTPTKIETAVHNMAMKRLQDGQFDECELSLRELSQIEASISKTLAAHHHGRIAYPKAPDEGEDEQSQSEQNGKK